MAAALLPDAGHALYWIIWGGIDSRPGRAAVVRGGDKRIPFAWETRCLVISGDIGAKETNPRSARCASYCFNFRSVLDAVGGADVEVVAPSDSVIRVTVSFHRARMAFRRIAGRHRPVVDIGIVDVAVRIDRARRISPLSPGNGD